jgi:putative flippase GtrA
MRETLGQMSRYLIGAVLALVIDAAIVTVLVRFGAPVVLARLMAMLAGITTTYLFNRRYTFRPTHPASLGDWWRYVAAQSVGAVVNFVISTGLLYWSNREPWQIWGAIAAGAAVGFCINFFAARHRLHR